MSDINTNGINVSYPVPGVNNNSQGFRDNFASIKNNLDTAQLEVSDLQNKVVVKSALNGVSIDNNMANTLISNALVKGFRSTTFPLGNDLSGTKTVDITKGDVHYGSVAGNSNVTLQFGGWAPTGTQSNVQIKLTFADSNSYVILPDTFVNVIDGSLISGMAFNTPLLENYRSSAVSGTQYTNIIAAPFGVTDIHFNVTTTDCGTIMEIVPINRPLKTTQVSTRTPDPLGDVGDKAGAMCSDTGNLYFCIANYDGSATIWKKVTLGSI